MIPDFFDSPSAVTHFGVLKPIIGLLIVIFATFVGVEISLGNDEDDN
tara:strand:- start:486 stop:626 length:141 start_codon:yes stop_codon:yes gene_type:complete